MKLREGNVFTPVCHSVHSGVSVQGGLCPEGSLPGGSLSGRSLSMGVSVQGGPCPGGPLSGRPPPNGNEQMVHILLECILVSENIWLL